MKTTPQRAARGAQRHRGLHRALFWEATTGLGYNPDLGLFYVPVNEWDGHLEQSITFKKGAALGAGF
jgi:hypothetical protein